MKGFSPEYECRWRLRERHRRGAIGFHLESINKKQGEDYGDHDICGD